MALNPFAFGTPLSSFGSQQLPFGLSLMQQQPVQQIAQLLQIVTQQQQQLLQIAHIQQHQLQYLHQVVQSLPAQVAQLQQYAGQVAGGAGFSGLTPLGASPLSGLQANYVM